MGLFGPSKGEVWQQFSNSIGATYTPGKLFRGDRVDAQVGEWIVTLDTYVESSGETSTSYTRLRAPFRNPTSLRFSVHRSGILTRIGRSLGYRSIVVGDPAFDESFAVSGNQESQIVELFQDPQIRQLLECQPSVRFDVRDNEGWFGPQFPSDTDELHFLSYGTIKDLDQLRSLFELFAAVLHRLTVIDAASADSPGVML